MQFTVADRGSTGFVTETLVSERCADCGILFAMPQGFIAKHRETGERFHCPNGHSLTYGESEAVRERKKREACEAKAAKEKAELERRVQIAHENEQIQYEARKSVERRLRGQKGATTRMKRRIAAGRCPCCSHQFKDLERHMATKHPKWDPDRHAEAIAAQEGSQEPRTATIGGAADV